jgi:hypothetical protein
LVSDSEYEKKINNLIEITPTFGRTAETRDLVLLDREVIIWTRASEQVFHRKPGKMHAP